MRTPPLLTGQIHDEKFRKHFRRTLITFATTLGYHRGIFEATETGGVATGFWYTTANSHYDIAVIEWCKVLGTNSEALHWKRAFEEDDYDAIRANVLAASGKTGDEWETYHGELLHYRNNVGAHFDPDVRVPVYPSLSPAQAAAGAIYHRLQTLYNVGGPDIDAICRRAERSAREAAAAYVKGRDAP